MEMKRKNVMKMLTLLITLGFVTLFGFQANSQTVSSFIESIEGRSPTPDTFPEEYDGPQTVNGLMNVFDAAYNQKYSKARVMALCEDGVVYSSELAIRGEIDARYPRIEWLQMLLQRGITIKNFNDYRIYLSKRHTLAFLEDNPDLRKAEFLGILATDNWKAYTAAYIDKLVDIHTKVRRASERAAQVKQKAEHTKELVERAKQRAQRAKKLAAQAKQKAERAKAQIERAKERIERAKTQPEHRIKREPTKIQLKRVQTAAPKSNDPKPKSIKKSPYPAL